MHLKLKYYIIKPIFIFTLIVSLIYVIGCGKNKDFGIGPVKDELKLGAIDDNLVKKGDEIFHVKCVSCHKFNSKLVGPPLKDVTKRRRPEWIMNMMLNPDEMTKKDKVAKELFSQYLVQMTFQDVSMDDARAMLEYFRAIDEGKVAPKE
jgi:mono/diheme cytochrome c family protein